MWAMVMEMKTTDKCLPYEEKIVKTYERNPAIRALSAGLTEKIETKLPDLEELAQWGKPIRDKR